MWLQNNHADLEIRKPEDSAHEWHFLNAAGAGKAVVVSICPLNSPSLVVCDMKNEEAVGEAKRLLTEGWSVALQSDRWTRLAARTPAKEG